MVASKSAKAVRKAVKATVESAAARVAELVSERDAPTVPGAPGPGTPPLGEPTRRRDPLPPKPDQAAPERRTADGCPDRRRREAEVGSRAGS